MTAPIGFVQDALRWRRAALPRWHHIRDGHILNLLLWTGIGIAAGDVQWLRWAATIIAPGCTLLLWHAMSHLDRLTSDIERLERGEDIWL